MGPCQSICSGGVPKDFDPKAKFEDKYSFINDDHDDAVVLGQGAFSTVRLATLRDQSSINSGDAAGSNIKKFAVKLVDKNKLSSIDLRCLRNEAHILKSVEHPNIVRCFDYFEDSSFCYVVLEYLVGGDLVHLIMQKDHFNEKLARDIVIKLLGALEHCHQRDIVHRDFKPDNILLPTVDASDANVKLSDFGLAAEAPGANLCFMCGSPMYLAPEMVRGERYGKPVDMWALGVTVFMMLSGHFPFGETADGWRGLVAQIERGKIEFKQPCWTNVSDNAKFFIRGLMLKNPAKRLTAKQAREHPWFLSPGEELEKRNLTETLEVFKAHHISRRRTMSGPLAALNVGDSSPSRSSSASTTRSEMPSWIREYHGNHSQPTSGKEQDGGDQQQPQQQQPHEHGVLGAFNIDVELSYDMKTHIAGVGSSSRDEAGNSGGDCDDDYGLIAVLDSPSPSRGGGGGRGGLHKTVITTENGENDRNINNQGNNRNDEESESGGGMRIDSDKGGHHVLCACCRCPVKKLAPGAIAHHPSVDEDLLYCADVPPPNKLVRSKSLPQKLRYLSKGLSGSGKQRSSKKSPSNK